MLGGTLALLNHSLTLDARLLRHHLYRLLFVGIIYFFVLGATLQSLMRGAPGRWLFGSITYLNFGFITLAGISFFATAVSEEKEEGTLGLLRMAGIGPTALLLGKSTSRLIIAGLLLSAQFPFTLLSITLGGVTTLQVFSVFFALLAYTALIANLALVCSVFASRASRASGMMVLAVAAFFFAPPLLNWFGSMLLAEFPSPRVSAALETFFDPRYDASVLNRLSVIMATGFDESPLSFQVLSNLAAAVVLFGVSRLLFARPVRNDAAPAARRVLIRPRGWWKPLSTGRVWTSAMTWKDFHFITGGKPLGAAKFVLYGLLVGAVACLMWLTTSRFPWNEFAVWTVSLTSAAIAIETSIYASRFLNDELKNGTLPGLVMLPTSSWRIGYSKASGCLLGILPAAFWLFVGCVPLFADLLVRAPEGAAWGLFACGTAVVVHVVFLHLTAYLSLVVKWGALPLALGIVFTFTYCGSPFLILPFMLLGAAASEVGGEALGALLMMMPTFGIGAGFVVLLQMLIGERLRAVAAR